MLAMHRNERRHGLQAGEYSSRQAIEILKDGKAKGAHISRKSDDGGRFGNQWCSHRSSNSAFLVQDRQ